MPTTSPAPLRSARTAWPWRGDRPRLRLTRRQVLDLETAHRDEYTPWYPCPVTRDWNAAAYDRLPIPMTRWGETVLGWLALEGDERVLDAGCGTGQVTAALLERLPRARSSPSTAPPR